MATGNNLSFHRLLIVGINWTLKVLPWLLIAVLLAQRIQIYQKEHSQAGRTVNEFGVQVLSRVGDWDSTRIDLTSGKRILVFWATWCGPCQLELYRLNALVKDGTIAGDKILAISSLEDPKLVSKTASERGYLFPIAIDPTGVVAERFQVSATPTTVFLDGIKIDKISTGMTLMLASGIQEFLRQQN